MCDHPKDLMAAKSQFPIIDLSGISNFGISNFDKSFKFL